MGKAKAPAAPDPKETAAAQTGTNVATATANSVLGNVNQVTPYGSLTYTQSGTYPMTDPTTGKTYDLPKSTATQTLNSAQQAILDQNNRADLNLATLAADQSGKLNSILGTPFSLGGAPAAGNAASLTAPQYQQFSSGPQLQTSIANAGDITKTYGTDYASNVKEVQDALMARMQPSLDQNRTALETKLANQGIQIGSAAYDSAMNSFGQQENDARYGAILNAGQEQTRLAQLANQQATFQNSAQAQQYGQNANNASFANTANQQMAQNQNTATSGNNALQDQSFNAQQAIINAQNTQRANWMNEQYASRNQPINEITGLLSGAGVTNPNFVSAQGTSIPTVDYAGLVQQNYANQVGAYNAQQAQSQSLMGGLFGLGSALIMSDERTKTDIDKVGELEGHNIYQFRYKSGGPMQLGVMAQEVEKDRPDVVQKIGGIRHVDYGKLFRLGEAA